MSQFCYTIILLIFIPSLAVSQPQNFQFEHFTVKDGLSHNRVRCILQDRQGFMWFGTDQGLNKFDGYHFTAYKNMPQDTNSIAAGWIPCLFEDSDGFIWIGTWGGLNKFDPRTEKFSHYFHDEKRAESLSSNMVNSIIEDREGYIWIGTSRGLNRFDRKTEKFKHFVHDPNNPTSISLDFINCLYEDSQGELWIGTGTPLIYDEKSGGINKFNWKTETFIRFKFEPNRFGYTNLINDIDEDASGNLWVATEFGLRVFDRNTNIFTTHFHFNTNSILSSARNTIKTVLVDSRGNVWFGSYAGGLNRLDKLTGESIQYHNNPQDSYSLSQNKVCSIYEDRNGCLWIGTEGGGINRINLNSSFFQHYRKDISEEKIQQVYDVNNVRSVYEDRSGKVWFGSEGEINMLDRSASVIDWTTIPFIHRGTFVESIVEDDAGILWIGITHGLIRYDPIKKQQKWYTFSESGSGAILPFYIHTMLIDQQGLLWLGTEQGLYRFDRQHETYTRFVHNSEATNTLSDNHIISMLKDSLGFFWIGTAGGLNKFDPVKQVFLNFQIDKRIFDNLRPNDLRTMCEDQLGNLWIGTSFGLKILDRGTESIRLFTQQDGLPDNAICGLIADDRGNIWISTFNGLSRYNPATKDFKKYDHNDGIRNITFNRGACLKNKNGELFFGGTNGLTVFHPDSLKNNPHPPSIVLTDFKINYESVKIGPDSPLKKSITFTEMIKLDYDQNFISFEFAALDYASPKKNLYAYKLEGVNPDWVYTDAAHRIASYTNLDPGKYIFKVKGSNNDGVWNEQGASVEIIIAPPFWQTAWFRLLILLAIAGLIYLLYRYRINRVRELERMRIQIASDLHDDIGSNLTKIAVYSELIQTTTEKNKVKETSGKIGNMSREVITTLSDVVWSIDARNDTVGDLIDRMRDFLDTAFPPGSVQIDFQTSGLFFQQKINQALRQNIYLIFKEAINNAAKHAQASQIHICLTNGEGKFRMEIADDGIGIDVTQPRSGHHGLANMKLRAERINGDLQIETQPGTRVILTVKAI